jgi:hypothetical protein
MSKPIRLTEFGCPAVDKGANSPNLFIDPKSSESFLPPYSTGERDDFGQRRYLETVLAWLEEPAANPLSPVYGGPMIEAASAWCWDARPFPDFPARSDVWRDGDNWVLGHWLTGRAGIAPLPELIQALGARAGVAIDPGEAGGSVGGYVVDRPMRLRDALGPLTEAFALDPVERGDHVKMMSRSGRAVTTLADDDLALARRRASGDRDPRARPRRRGAAPALPRRGPRLPGRGAGRAARDGAGDARRRRADRAGGLGSRGRGPPDAGRRRGRAADADRAPVAFGRPAAGGRRPLGVDGVTGGCSGSISTSGRAPPWFRYWPGTASAAASTGRPAPPREPPAPPVLHVLDLPADGSPDRRRAAPGRGGERAVAAAGHPRRRRRRRP